MKNLTIASIVLGWCSYIVTYLLGLFISQFKASDRAFWSHIVVPGGFLGHGLILSDEAILCRLMLELLWLWSCDRLYWDRCYISNLGCGLSVYQCFRQKSPFGSIVYQVFGFDIVSFQKRAYVIGLGVKTRNISYCYSSI